MDEKSLHLFGILLDGDIDQFWNVVGNLMVFAFEESMDEGASQSFITIFEMYVA